MRELSGFTSGSTDTELRRISSRDPRWGRVQGGARGAGDVDEALELRNEVASRLSVARVREALHKEYVLNQKNADHCGRMNYLL